MCSAVFGGGEVVGGVEVARIGRRIRQALQTERLGQSTSFESHIILYTANIPGFENVANLKVLPATGSFVVALPMKIEGGSGAPLRIIAFIPR